MISKIQKLKMSSILLLTIFLSSCNSFPWPKPKDKERCGIFLEKVQENLWKGKCRCHQYRISREEIGRVSESVDHDLSYCSRLVGFNPSTWAELVSWFQEIQIWDEQRMNKSDLEFIEDEEWTHSQLEDN